MLSAALSGLVLICNSFEKTFLPSSCLPASLLLHLDDCDKQHHSSSQKMGQICDLETVKPLEISFKVYVMFYNALSN